MISIYSKNSGIALVLVVGVLSILAMVSVGFSAFSQLELQATQNYVNQFRAELIAEAGISRAIEELKYKSGGCQSDPYDTTRDSWYYQDGVSVDLKDAASPSFGGEIDYGDDGGKYKLKVIDCAGLININTPLPSSAAEAEFENILSGLALAAGVTGAQLTAFSNDLIPYRKNNLPDGISDGISDGIFRSKEEIKLVAGIGQETYEKVKDFITLYGDADMGTGHTQKTFVNVNTAPFEVLWAVLRPMMEDNTRCSDFIDNLISQRSTNPFDGKNPDANLINFLSARAEFQRFIEYQASLNVISSAEKDAIITQTDPNRNVTFTTCFCFDSGGCYEIEALGIYQGAVKRISRVVSIYKKIHTTTYAEFRGEDVNFNGVLDAGEDLNGNGILDVPQCARVTVKDDVPLNLSACYAGYAYDSSQAETIPDSIKLGFWDDFSDPDYSLSVWKGSSDAEYTTIFTVENGELRTQMVQPTKNFPIVTLGSAAANDPWLLAPFSAIVHIEDEKDQEKYVSRLNFPWPSVPKGWTSAPDYILRDSDPSGWVDIGDDSYMYGLKVVKDKMFQEYMNVGQILVRFGDFGRSEGVVYITEEQKEISHESVFGGIDIEKESGWMVVWDDDTVSWEWHYYTPDGETGGGSWQYGRSLLIRNSDVYTVKVSCNPYLPDKTMHLLVNTVDRYKSIKATVFGDSGSIEVTHNNCYKLNAIGALALYGSENLPDMDNVRVIPAQGVYTSYSLTPAVTPWEWGTISAGVTLPDAAQSATQTVSITTNLSSSSENFSIPPDPRGLPPADSRVIPASGDYINLSVASVPLRYRLWLFSEYNIDASNLEQIPVVEDVTITYLPKTVVLSQSSN